MKKYYLAFLLFVSSVYAEDECLSFSLARHYAPKQCVERNVNLITGELCTQRVGYKLKKEETIVGEDEYAILYEGKREALLFKKKKKAFKPVYTGLGYSNIHQGFPVSGKEHIANRALYFKDDKALLFFGDGSYALYKKDGSYYFLERIKLPNGNQKVLSYDEKKRPKELKEVNGDESLIISLEEYAQSQNVHGELEYIDQMVAKQSFPIDEERQEIYTYTYDEKKTTCTNTLGHITHYYFDFLHRLVRIEKEENECIIQKETFLWGQPKTSSEGDLQVYALFDEKGQCVLAKRYHYDIKHNVIREIHYGNFCTKRGGSISFDKAGFPLESSLYDKKEIKRVYSQDGFNNKLEECDPEGNWTMYTYKEGTDLLTGRFVCHGRLIKKRELFSYDDEGLLLESRVDNGSSQIDERGVTESYITSLKRRKRLPNYGAPEEEVFYAVDGETKRRKVLSRVVYSYTSKGELERKEYYDSHGALQKEEKEEEEKDQRICLYNKRGDCIEETKKLRNDVELIYSYLYDACRRLVAKKDPHGYETRYLYNGLNQCIRIEFASITNPDGTSIEGIKQFFYSSAGQKVTEVDEGGYSHERIYSIDGKLLYEKEPDGSTKEYEYDLQGRKVKEYISSKAWKTFSYDYQGRPCLEELHYDGKKAVIQERRYSAFHKVYERNNVSSETHWKYNEKGKVKEKREVDFVEGNEHKELYSFDWMGRLEERQFFLDKGEKFFAELYNYKEGDLHKSLEDYDGKIYKVEKDKEEGSNSAFEYFCKDQKGILFVKQITKDPRGMRREVVFNARGKPMRFLYFDPLGNQIGRKEFFYDSQLNIVRADFYSLMVGGNTVFSHLFEYGPCGKINKITYSKGSDEERVEHFFYTSTGQKRMTEASDGKKICYFYDSLHRLKNYYDEAATFDYSFEYDLQGHVILAQNNFTGGKTQRKYNGFGNLIEEVFETGFKVSYSYDSCRRIKTITLPDGSHIAYQYSPLFLKEVQRRSRNNEELYSYRILDRDGEGKPLYMLLPQRGGALKWRYDSKGRKVEITHSFFHEEIPADGIDPSSNITKIIRQDPLSEVVSTFSYDFFSQLIEEKGDEAHTYLYDSLYSRWQKDDDVSYTLNGLMGVIRAGELDFFCDPSGNRQKAVSWHGTTSYTYDGLNRLTQLESGSKKIQYTYDPFHRRLKKEEIREGVFYDSVSKREFYLNIFDEELGIYNQKGELEALKVVGYDDCKHLCSMELSKKLYVPITNFRGDVTLLLQGQRMLLENVYRYGAYGKPVAYGHNFETIPKAKSPWLFGGRYFEEDTGLIYYNSRYFDPRSGSFLSLKYNDILLGKNPYLFRDNNPLKPEGKKEKKECCDFSFW